MRRYKSLFLSACGWANIWWEGRWWGLSLISDLINGFKILFIDCDLVGPWKYHKRKTEAVLEHLSTWAFFVYKLELEHLSTWTLDHLSNWAFYPFHLEHNVRWWSWTWLTRSLNTWPRTFSQTNQSSGEISFLRSHVNSLTRFSWKPS